MAIKADELLELQAQARELGIETHAQTYIEVGLLSVPLDKAGEFFMREYGNLPNASLVIGPTYAGYLETRIYHDQPRPASDLRKEIRAKLRQLGRDEKARIKQSEKEREAELRELARLKAKYEENVSQ